MLFIQQTLTKPPAQMDAIVFLFSPSSQHSNVGHWKLSRIPAISLTTTQQMQDRNESKQLETNFLTLVTLTHMNNCEIYKNI